MKISYVNRKKVLNIYFLISLFSVLIFSSCSSSYKIMENSTWKLVYENDQNGKTVNGDIHFLIDAILEGKEVRVLTYNDEQIYLTDAENIWVRNGIVFIQNSSNISASFTGDNLFFIDDTYHWYFTLNSEGKRNMSRWLVGEHTLKKNSSDKVAIKWFIR